MSEQGILTFAYWKVVVLGITDLFIYFIAILWGRDRNEWPEVLPSEIAKSNSVGVRILGYVASKREGWHCDWRKGKLPSVMLASCKGANLCPSCSISSPAPCPWS